MPKITDTPPLYVQKELAVLQKDLDETIPAKKLDQNVLICTWNIRAFGAWFRCPFPMDAPRITRLYSIHIPRITRL